MAKNEDWEGYYPSWSLVAKSDTRAIGMEDKDRYYLFAYGIEALNSPAAAAANLLWEFNIAPKKDDKLTNIKNGKVILVKAIANSIFA